eukprot:TRINITY_DN2775_c0_g1_i2.p1 TRINITY_DN2775_c0_g1~~TRINITY_DN2775_c0_g1_i2.p1  ORF type:complete len:117 (-),score=17.01 TRINITY_DN2775_c0_g1_i2:11-361(-)
MPVEVGDEIVLDKVLLVGSKTFTAVGKPILTRAKVYAQVQETTKTENVTIFKKRRRKNYRLKKGYRASITVLHVKDIVADLEGLVQIETPSITSASPDSSSVEQLQASQETPNTSQ